MYEIYTYPYNKLFYGTISSTTRESDINEWAYGHNAVYKWEIFYQRDNSSAHGISYKTISSSRLYKCELHIYLFGLSILPAYSYYLSNLIIICLYCVNQNQDSNKRMEYRLLVCNRPSMLVSLSLENGACWRVPNEFWTFNSSWISLNENTRRILNNNSRLFIFSLFIAF